MNFLGNSEIFWTGEHFRSVQERKTHVHRVGCNRFGFLHDAMSRIGWRNLLPKFTLHAVFSCTGNSKNVRSDLYCLVRIRPCGGLGLDNFPRFRKHARCRPGINLHCFPDINRAFIKVNPFKLKYQ